MHRFCPIQESGCRWNHKGKAVELKIWVSDLPYAGYVRPLITELKQKKVTAWDTHDCVHR